MGKWVRIVGDATALEYDYLHLVDESGEDYAYAVHHFYLPGLPEEVEETLL